MESQLLAPWFTELKLQTSEWCVCVCACVCVRACVHACMSACMCMCVGGDGNAIVFCLDFVFLFLRYKRMTTRKWWKHKHNPCKHVINTGDHPTYPDSQILLSIFHTQYTRAIRGGGWGGGDLSKKALCSPKQTWGFLATADETPSLGCYDWRLG